MPGIIIFVADSHIGINFPYKRNVTTGISERSLDFVKNLGLVVDYAIANDCKLLVIAGDLYDRPGVTPTFRKIVREEIFLPLAEAGIPVVLVSGNHDSPLSLQRGSSIEDLSLLENVEVFRKPASMVKRIGGKSVGLILVPFLHPSQIIGFLEKQVEVGPVDIEKQFSSSQELMKNWILYKTEDLETELKFIVGHYYIKGTKISSDYNPEVLPGEFTFTESMIPYNDVDLCVFGHIHLYQSLKDGKILIPGSIERIDFGERGDSKGFIEFDIDNKKWNFKQLETRPLIKKEIEIPDDLDPTEYVLNEIKKLDNLVEAIIRLEIMVSLENEMKLDLPAIEKALNKTFYFEIKFIQKQIEVDKTILESYTLDPIKLLTDYIDQAFSSYDKKEKLEATAKLILRGLIEGEE